MRKIIDKKKLNNLVSSVKLDVHFAVCNQDYREPIKQAIEKDIENKIAELKNMYDNMYSLELINNAFWYDDKIFISYNIWSDRAVLYNKRGHVHSYKFFPFAITLYIDQNNKNFLASRHGEFIQFDNREIPREFKPTGHIYTREKEKPLYIKHIREQLNDNLNDSFHVSKVDTETLKLEFYKYADVLPVTTRLSEKFNVNNVIGNELEYTITNII